MSIFLTVERADGVGHMKLSRAEALNALSK